MHHSHPADVHESESDSDAVSDACFPPSPSKQAFTHLGNLDTRTLKPSRIGRETDRKKASVLPSLTTVSSCNRYGLLVYGFEYRLILSMFYVWFRVSFDTQYVLCLVSSIV